MSPPLSAHTHTEENTTFRRLLLGVILNALITLLQIAGGIISNSLGLITDALHNLSDVVALGLSLWAIRLGRKPATPTRTFAFRRAEILVALFNSAVLLAVSLYLVVEAVRRLLAPQPVEGIWMIALAGAGLAVNTGSALLLRSHVHDLNLRAAFLHLVGDALTSLAVIAGGIVIWLWSWNYADPLITIFISLWIGRAAYGLLKSAVHVLMEGTPEGMELADVKAAMVAMPGVLGVHDLHIWSISSKDVVLSAHVVTAGDTLSEGTAVSAAIKEMLARNFGIGHVTLELEAAERGCAGGTCESPAPDR